MKYSEFLGKKYLLIILGSVAIYSAFLFFSDFNQVYDTIQNFQTSSIPLILIIIFSSWLVVFLRWTILLNKHELHIPLKLNILIFFAGFTLAISPAKSGELIKTILLKNKCQIPITKSIPIIFLERFYDMIGTAAVAALGITFLGLDLGLILIPIILMIIGIFYLFYSRKGFSIALKILNYIKPLKKFSENAEESHRIIRTASDVKTICSCSGLTIIFRLIESFGIIFILAALGIDFINFLNLLSMYSISVIIGSASMSPGGLGVIEGSFAGLLTLEGIDLKTTLAIAVIVRFFTLWFAVLVGFISLKMINLVKDNPKN